METSLKKTTRSSKVEMSTDQSSKPLTESTPSIYTDPYFHLYAFTPIENVTD